jgi:transcriptional regulator with XRE-family HTH domain
MTARHVLAVNVRRFRQKLGWSQERLADEAGLHRTYIGGIEREERNVSLDSIEKLASALCMAVHELMVPRAMK